MTRQIGREWNFLVLETNTIYLINIFASCIGSTKFIIFFMDYTKCENIFTPTEVRFLPNAPTQNRPPDSRLRQTQTSPDPTVRSTTLSFPLIATRVATVRTQFQFFSASHKRRTRTVERGGHWLLRYDWAQELTFVRFHMRPQVAGQGELLVAELASMRFVSCNNTEVPDVKTFRARSGNTL
jgi:hypothetical protein